MLDLSYGLFESKNLITYKNNVKILHDIVIVGIDHITRIYISSKL